MADRLRPIRTALRVVDVVLRWAFGLIATVVGCLCGLVFVAAVYGTYGPRAGILTTLALAVVTVVVLAAAGIRNSTQPKSRHDAHPNSSPAQHRKVA